MAGSSNDDEFVPIYRGRTNVQEIGDADYVLSTQERNITQCRASMLDMVNKLDTQMDYLMAQKQQLTCCMVRSQMVETTDVIEALKIAENTQTIADQIKSVDDAQTAIANAHGLLLHKCQTPLMFPSQKEYLKKQLDETTSLDIVHKQRLKRAVEKAKRSNGGEIPQWDASDPNTWIFYGWTPPEEGIPAWKKDDPTTWVYYGWKPKGEWVEYGDTTNEENKQVTQEDPAPGSLEEAFPPKAKQQAKARPPA